MVVLGEGRALMSEVSPSGDLGEFLLLEPPAFECVPQRVIFLHRQLWIDPVWGLGERG